MKATYFPFDLFSRISERLLLLKLHIGKWLLLKIKDVNTSLAKSGFWDFYWNSFFFVACKKRICVCFNKWPTKSSLVPQPTCCWKSKSDGDPIYPTQAVKENPDSKKLYEVRFFPLLYSCFSLIAVLVTLHSFLVCCQWMPRCSVVIMSKTQKKNSCPS